MIGKLSLAMSLFHIHMLDLRWLLSARNCEVHMERKVDIVVMVISATQVSFSPNDLLS
jgi:hypothetical protein